MKHRLICPHCETKFSFVITPPKSYHTVKCSDCQKEFDILIARIRAKRSRGNRKTNSRDFDVRVTKLSGKEELLQFQNAQYEDFELRQGDEGIFYYVSDTLKFVHNVSIDERYLISRSSQKFCYLATYVYGAESEEVALLRRFRDEILIPNPALSKFVRVYYWLSPKMIRLFGKATYWKFIVKAVVTPVLWLARKRMASSAHPKQTAEVILAQKT